MVKFFKWTVASLILLILVAFLFIRFSMGMSLPEGRSGAEADLLAQKMMTRIGSESWNNTRFVSWTFAERNTYIWDRTRSLVHIVSGDVEVVLNTEDHTGWGKENGELVSAIEHDRLMEWAWSNFCNDSFWLIAPLKVMDQDVQRKLVSTEKGDALLVEYETGGVTPGDAYLWYVNDDGLPYAYRMWVSIIPVAGLEVSWEDYAKLHTGTLIAQRHMLGPLNISITELKSGSDLTELGMNKDPFEL